MCVYHRDEMIWVSTSLSSFSTTPPQLIPSASSSLAPELSLEHITYTPGKELLSLFPLTRRLNISCPKALSSSLSSQAKPTDTSQHDVLYHIK